MDSQVLWGHSLRDLVAILSRLLYNQIDWDAKSKELGLH